MKTRSVNKARFVSKRYYLAFEGKKTEQVYFGALEKNRVFSKNVCTIRFIRGPAESSNSHPTNIVKMVGDYIRLQTEGVYSVDLFINNVLDELRETKQLRFSNDEAPAMGRLLRKELEKMGLVEGRTIKDTSLAIVVAEEHFKKERNLAAIAIDLSAYKEPHYQNCENDDYCIIVDRDQGNFFPEQVEEVINTCERENYRLFITNPYFEMWLLLHFDVPKEVIIKRSMELHGLKEELAKYSKINTEYTDVSNEYVPAVKIAMEKLENYAQDLSKLKELTSPDSIGSNIGELMTELISGRTV